MSYRGVGIVPQDNKGFLQRLIGRNWLTLRDITSFRSVIEWRPSWKGTPCMEAYHWCKGLAPAGINKQIGLTEGEELVVLPSAFPREISNRLFLFRLWEVLARFYMGLSCGLCKMFISFALLFLGLAFPSLHGCALGRWEFLSCLFLPGALVILYSYYLLFYTPQKKRSEVGKGSKTSKTSSLARRKKHEIYLL